jgi:hypothetical protein
MSNQIAAQRPDGLTIVSIWHYLSGGIFLLVTVVVAFMTLAFGLGAVFHEAELVIPSFIFGIITLAFMALAILNMIIGYGLWILKPWARTAAMALAMVSLLFVPIGTIAGALILWYLLKPDVAVFFEKKTT